MIIANLIAKGRKLFGILAVPSWRRALLSHRVAAGVEHRVVLRHLGEVRSIVDIGANRGQFALAARYCVPDARIVSFEPLPEPAAVFQQLFAKDNTVVLHEAAIGPKVVNCTMHVSARDDSSSLLPIASTQTKMFPGTGEIATTEVRVAPLDEFITVDTLRAPAMLKLDVQGFEHEALVGCESLLRYFGLIYCECSFIELYTGQKLAWEIIDWLSTRGFSLIGIFNTTYGRGGRAVQADFLFTRKHDSSVVAE